MPVFPVFSGQDDFDPEFFWCSNEDADGDPRPLQADHVDLADQRRRAAGADRTSLSLQVMISPASVMA